MAQKPHGRVSFLQQIDTQLQQYHREKQLRASLHPREGDCARKEQIAREALMQMDDDHEVWEQEDVQIGRWSNYRVAEKVQERASCARKPSQNEGRAGHECRYLAERERPACVSRSHSEKTIPKLKCILHQLEASLHLPESRESHRPSDSAKNLRFYKKTEVLMPSNKQEAPKSCATTERKMLRPAETCQNRENSRPESHTANAKPHGSQKPQLGRLPFGFATHDNEPVYEKEMLSQLIKGSLPKATPETSPLRNMLNYFTSSAGNKVSRGSSRNRLDKILC